MERRDMMTDGPTGQRRLPGSYVDLPAIIGGALVAAAAAGVFTTFGAALGFSSFSAEPGEGSSFTLWMVISFIWMVLTTLLSFSAGGYVVGRLRRRLETTTDDEIATRDGLNGLIVWALGIVAAGWMAASVIGGAASLAGSTVSAAGQAVGQAASGLAQGAGAAIGGAASNDGAQSALNYVNDSLMRPVLDGVNQSNGSLVPSRPAAEPEELARQSGMILGNVLRTGEISDDEKAFLVAATAQKTGLSEEEVTARVDQAVKSAQDMRAEAEKMAADAKQAAIDAAETARKGSILAAFLTAAVALGAAAAAVAAAVAGGRHRDENRVFGGLIHR